MKSLTSLTIFALSLTFIPAAAQSAPATPVPCPQPCDTVCPAGAPVPCNARVDFVCPSLSGDRACKDCPECQVPTVCPEEYEPCTPAPCYRQDGAQGRRHGKHAPRHGRRFQPRDGADVPGGPLSQRAFRGLDLTPSQQAAIKSLSDKRASESKKLAEDMKKKRFKMQEKYDKKLQKILTPEQYAQYKDRRGRVRRGPARRPDGIVGPVVPAPKPMPMTEK